MRSVCDRDKAGTCGGGTDCTGSNYDASGIERSGCIVAVGRFVNDFSNTGWYNGYASSFQVMYEVVFGVRDVCCSLICFF